MKTKAEIEVRQITSQGTSGATGSCKRQEGILHLFLKRGGPPLSPWFVFYPPDTWDNKFLMFRATKLVVICDVSLRKPTQAHVLHIILWILNSSILLLNMSGLYLDLCAWYIHIWYSMDSLFGISHLSENIFVFRLL